MRDRAAPVIQTLLDSISIALISLSGESVDQQVGFLSEAVSASDGIAAGRIALDSETAARWASEGDGAVVARQLGKVCLVGCSELAIDMSARRCRIAGRELMEGDWLCLDGNFGRVLAGRPELVTCRPTEWLRRVEGWKGRRGDSIPATADEFA